MSDVIASITNFIQGNLTLQVFLLIFAAVVVNFLVMMLLRRVKLFSDKTNMPWDDIFIDSVGKPLSVLLIYTACNYAAKLLYNHSTNVVLGKFIELENIAYLLIVGWFLIRFVKRAEGLYVSHNKFDTTTVTAIAKLLRFSIVITTVLMVIDALGYSIKGVLAFGGIGGIAVGFAAKDLLANFFGGLIIYLDRPFKVGDWIRSPDRTIEGTVEDIGWRVTKIRTFDKRPLYIPNSVFTTIAIENPSRMSHRRIKETIGLRYDDSAKLALIIEDVKTMLKQHEDIATNETLMVNFDAFADSSLNFFIYAFTKTTNWQRYHEVKQDVLIKIMEIVDQHQAEIAFPTNTVHLLQQGEE